MAQFGIETDVDFGPPLLTGITADINPIAGKSSDGDDTRFTSTMSLTKLTSTFTVPFADPPKLETEDFENDGNYLFDNERSRVLGSQPHSKARKGIGFLLSPSPWALLFEFHCG